MVEAQGLALRPPDTDRPWSYEGHAPHDADWNTRAARPGRPRSLPVVG
jgi:biotin synthase